MERLIAQDRLPDLLSSHLHATPVDEAYLAKEGGLPGRVLRRLPLPLAQALVALRERRRYDVVMTWSEPATYLLASLLLLTRARTTHVSVHSWISKPKKAVPLRLLHAGITRIVVPPPTQRRFALRVLRLPPHKLPAARWSVDLDFWRPFEETTDTISCVGREMRDYPTLIEAVRGTDVPCHIAAGAARAVDNPWWDRIDASLPSNVTVGARRGTELRELYARSRFTVVPLLPSYTDNGVTAILESFAMGTPVICTETQGQVDVVEDGVNGLLVPAGSPEALRSAILRLWNDPAECARLGKNGRRFVEEKHSVDQWVSALLGQPVEPGPDRGTGRRRGRAR
jgi:glycosyltransferase involved in cell wall biosynthesis